jgi:protein SCO1/2/putative membrane protein
MTAIRVGGLVWSAAVLLRRFCFFVFSQTKNKSGGEAPPHSRPNRSDTGALLVVLLLPLLLAASPLAANESDDDDYGEVSDFRLTERDGRTITRDDLLGKVWIASFVLTRCPDGKCPQVTQTVKRLQEELAGRRDLRFVTFTVDPDRDDPGELQRYAEAYAADPERWLFLTGSEEQIDKVLRSFYVRAGERRKGDLSHSQALVLVDRHGHIRGTYPGMKQFSGDAEWDEDIYETGLRKLRRKADKLLEPELPAYLPKDFPAFNAMLNALSGVLILLGYAAIRQRRVRLHATCMLTAIVVSAIFLTSYLFYHLVVKEGRPTRFVEQAPGAPVWVGHVYLGILLTHTVLAVFAAPLAVYTAYRGLRGQILSHVRVARWTLPIWLYVSCTGVVVYWMLYRLYPPG